MKNIDEKSFYEIVDMLVIIAGTGISYIEVELGDNFRKSKEGYLISEIYGNLHENSTFELVSILSRIFLSHPFFISDDITEEDPIITHSIQETLEKRKTRGVYHDTPLYMWENNLNIDTIHKLDPEIPVPNHITRIIGTAAYYDKFPENYSLPQIKYIELEIGDYNIAKFFPNALVECIVKKNQINSFLEIEHLLDILHFIEGKKAYGFQRVKKLKKKTENLLLHYKDNIREFSNIFIILEKGIKIKAKDSDIRKIVAIVEEYLDIFGDE